MATSEEGPVDPYPELTAVDAARVGINAGLAAIPLVGGPVQILVEGILGPAFDRRRDRWLSELGETVNALSQRLDSLASDEVFISAVFEASRIAMGTGRDDKLRMLRECLINVAMAQGRDDFIALQMIRLVDSIEPEHVAVLRYFSNPRRWYEEYGLEQPYFTSAPRRAIMDRAQLPVAGPALGLVLRQLADLGLLESGLDGVVSENAVWAPLTTELGNTFLQFVLAAH